MHLANQQLCGKTCSNLLLIASVEKPKLQGYIIKAFKGKLKRTDGTIQLMAWNSMNYFV
jgi:hypothetical protein